MISGRGFLDGAALDLARAAGEADAKRTARLWRIFRDEERAATQRFRLVQSAIADRAELSAVGL